MERKQEPIIKHREICFRGPHAEEDQARSAMLLLVDARGVLGTRWIRPNVVGVSYDLRQIHFEALEQALADRGFHLDNSLMTKLRRALITYSEEIERANEGITGPSCDGDCAAKVFASAWKRRAHGCRDRRPEWMREYR
ncbi:MAG: hypothetical protein D6717_04195 [Gammaproteobacteria bacterium]|nr:MAG: hypothetical protein D6717_04195 [Gammaproteobacteria bacterium]